MTPVTDTQTTTQVYRIYIKASPQAVWDAITQPGWVERYGYCCPAEYELWPGGAYRALASEPMKAHGTPEVIIVGEVIEADPPHKLVQTWHPVWDPASAAEAVTTLTWQIEQEGEATRLTLTHDLTGAPLTAQMVSGQVPNAGGGWSYILSDLKTLLETGRTLGG